MIYLNFKINLFRNPYILWDYPLLNYYPPPYKKFSVAKFPCYPPLDKKFSVGMFPCSFSVYDNKNKTNFKNKMAICFNLKQTSHFSTRKRFYSKTDFMVH